MIEPTPIDVSLLLSLNGDGGATLDFLMYWISAKLTWAPLYLLLLYGVYRKFGLRKLLWFIGAVVLVIVLADQTATLAKTYLPKLRPSRYEPLEGLIHTNIYGYRGGLYGTISSHAANSMALCMLCGMVFRRRWIWFSLGLWVAIVSYSRIYLGVHYPFDIALGLIEGAMWGWIVARIYCKKILKR